MPAESPTGNPPSSVAPARHGGLPPRLVPILVALVLFLAAALRLADLREKPRWYADELFNLKVIQDLMAGEWRVRAVSWTCFSPFHPYPIGYHLAGAAFCSVLGDDVWTVRLLCGLLGVATTAFVFLIARTLYDDRAGLLAAVAYAIHPRIVLFTRWAFPQNLSPLFVTAAVWAALRYRQQPSGPRLAALSLLVGAATVSIYWAGPLLLLLAGVVFITQPRRTLPALGLALAPLLLQLAAAALVQGFAAVTYDLSRLFGLRVLEADEPAAGLASLAARALDGYRVLFLHDPFFVLGLLGLLWLPKSSDSALLLAALALLSLAPVAQRGPLLSDFFYNAVFFAPLPLLGFGVLFARLLHAAADIPEIVPRSHARLACNILVLAALGFGWFIVFRNTISTGPGGYQTRLDALGFTVSDAAAAQDAARFINERTEAEDFVIATPNLPWMLTCRSTDVQQMAARLPGGTIWYPRDLPRERFLYEPSHERARFLVADGLTFTFYLTVRNCDEVLYRIHAERWPLAAQFGEFRIYENPRLASIAEASNGGTPLLPVQIQIQLAELHEGRGHFEEAVRWYQRAIREGGEPVLRQLEEALEKNSERTPIRDALAGRVEKLPIH
ncbi:MAG: glycosyltransferase family 39 protein [Planctomycetes bacterium]|nr:glycosyltransferase family 39 protein [Planctomycetota bacterium]